MPLYLIPVTLGDTPHRQVLPGHNLDIILSIHHFIVENTRSARRFLKKAHPPLVIDTLTFYELNKHTPPESIAVFLAPLEQGISVGLLSEAGCPAIADPGAGVVAEAQHRGYPVIPLVGPSSILLALIASGLNGQSFAFNGYLPVERQARIHSLRHLENLVSSLRQTQIFIETPYRNDALAADILRTCRPDTLLCIATSLTCPNESVRTLPIVEWRRVGLPPLDHLPTIFLLGV
ncbi:MAG: SAM-dependent methyltransferase [Tannerellaceae bacterium]|nr:SAM-dependent methyltransferase [Tannerellaceae bacterium]